MAIACKRPLTEGWAPPEKKYDCHEKLGAGVYSTVFRATDATTPAREVALKRTDMDYEEGVPVSALKEISLLKHLGHHPNIVQLRDVVVSKEKLDVALELMPTTLKSMLERPLSPTDVCHYMRHLVAGVAHMHSKGTMHRDLKPENLLVDPRARVLKLSDLGMACFTAAPGREYSLNVVTRWYRAPEILMGCAAYTTAIDMWSVGCVFSEMARARALFRGATDADQLPRIFDILGTPTDAVWPGFTQLPEYRHSFVQRTDSGFIAEHRRWVGTAGVKLLRELLTYDPRCRATAAQAALSEYLK